jgi:hypothetical protein
LAKYLINREKNSKDSNELFLIAINIEEFYLTGAVYCMTRSIHEKVNSNVYMNLSQSFEFLFNTIENMKRKNILLFSETKLKIESLPLEKSRLYKEIHNNVTFNLI